MKRQNELRSFVLNMPCGMRRTCVNFEKEKINKKQLLLCSNYSKGSTMIATPITDFNVSESSQGYEKPKSKSSLGFLPYIYAQNGIDSLKAILKSEKHYETIDSLPLVRKQSTTTLVIRSPPKANSLFLSRYKSLEIYQEKRHF